MFEYSEEFPPLLNLVGMASKVFNYSNNSNSNNSISDKSNSDKIFGQNVKVTHTSPFLGHLRQGEMVQVKSTEKSNRFINEIKKF